MLWIFFAVRRRRRTRRLEHDTAVSATLEAAGFHRAPLDDEDEDDDPNAGGAKLRFGSPEMAQHSPRSSIPTSASIGRTSAYLNDVPIDGGFNPYTEHGVAGPSHSGFVAAGPANGSDQRISHSASHSAGSYEPLLASYYQSQNDAQRAPTPPPRNPQRAADRNPAADPAFLDNRDSAAPSYSSKSTADDRLDPELRKHSVLGDLRDDEDYSRPVLGVCGSSFSRSTLTFFPF